MKKKLFFVVIFLFLSFVFYRLGPNVFAQTSGPASIMGQNKIRTCLAADPTITKTRNRACDSNDPEDEAECEERGEWIFGEATEMHLTGTCEAPSGCEIWHENSAREVSGIEAGFRKIVNNVAAGKVDVTVPGPFRDHVSHTFYAIGDAPPVIVTGTAKGGVEAENKTQQIGQVSNFEFTEGQVKGSQQKCVSIYWDPFGRVFDAISLEPISGVSVGLFQDLSRQLVSLPNNPILTDKAGVYNIFVDKEDDYYLTVGAPSTHTFNGNVNLNPKYNLIYSNIYSPAEVFHEAPLPPSIPDDFDFGPYYHDIPLHPLGEPYRDAVAEVVEGTLRQVDLGDFVNYWGRVTYPLAQVCLVGETSGLISCTNADKYGVFSFEVDKLSIPQEFIEVQVEKVDLTELSRATIFDKVMSFFVKEVNAQSSIRIDPPSATPKPVGFNPILSYIEGYVYDKTGTIIPNAKIVVKLKANNEVFYQTTADENGFFIIYSNHLPFFEYYLDVTLPNGQTFTQTTTEFITFNQDYLNEQSLDLVKSTRLGEPIINPETGRENIMINTATPTILPQQPASSNNQIIAIAILLLFLIVALAGIVFYMMKRRS